MNVCYVVTSTIATGPVNVLYSMLKELVKNFKVNPYLICLEDDIPSDRSIRYKFEDLGVEVVQFNIKEIDKGIDFIKKNKIEVIHSHGLKPDFFNLIIKKKLKNNLFYCSTLHNFPYEDYVPLFGKFKGYLLAVIHMFISKELYSIACSKNIQLKYERLGLEIDLVENGIEFPSKIEINLSKNKKNFLYVGEIIKRKNLFFLIKIFEKLPDYNLIIVGNGSEYNFLKNKSNLSNNIHFVGRKKDPSFFYKKTDFYISASLSEGLPMSILEALSYGKPLLLSDILAHKYIVDEGQNGELFELTENNLIQKINEIVKMNFNYENIYKNAKKKYSSHVMTKKYYEIYRKNLG